MVYDKMAMFEGSDFWPDAALLGCRNVIQMGHCLVCLVLNKEHIGGIPGSKPLLR